MKINKLWIGTLGLWLVLSPIGFAGDALQVVQDHLAVAKAYEEKAKVYEQLAAEHEAMLKDRHKSYEDSRSWDRFNRNSSRGANDFLTPLMLGQKHRHCEAIAKSAKTLRSRMLEFAQFHRERASELEKSTQQGEGKNE